MKIIRLHRSVEKAIENWPLSIKVELSDLLALLASGISIGMPASRPMQNVAAGVHELRIKDRTGQYRIFYYTKTEVAILVFHAFKKKTQTTPKHEIDVGKIRLREIL